MPDLDERALRLLSYFAWEHLPPRLQDVSRPFCDLAHLAAEQIKDGDPGQVEMMLQHLLAAKDAAVRAAVTLH